MNLSKQKNIISPIYYAAKKNHSLSKIFMPVIFLSYEINLFNLLTQTLIIIYISFYTTKWSAECKLYL